MRKAVILPILFILVSFLACKSLVSQTTYFWVDGSGMWSDASHWATSSGGPGGAGVPDDQTNVVFDDNSFTAPGQMVEIDVATAQCHNMKWENNGTPQNPELAGNAANKIEINGSLTLINSMQMPFKGDFIFTASDSNNTIDLDDFLLKNNLVFQNGGQWTLENELRTQKVIDFKKGFLDADGFEILCSQFYSDYTTDRALDISSAIFQVSKTGNSWYVNTDNFKLMGTSSFVILHGPKPELINFGPDTLTFSGVLFADTSANATLKFGDYYQVFFGCDGTMEDYNKIDSLYFTPGKTYQITTSTQQIIEGGWFSIGADCYPIKIRSTLPGAQATINMGNSLMQFEHNEIKDLTVNGSGIFNAGKFSTDEGNNNGLTFGQANLIYSNILGNDTLLCPGDTKTLSTRYYWETAERKWQDNSTERTFTVTEEGEYYVRLTYFPGCHLDDTIYVDYSDVAVDLGPDTLLCTGDQLLLETNPQPTWSVSWHDQSTDEDFLVQNPGAFYATVEDTNDCQVSDTVEVTEVPLPTADLGADTAICQGEQISLQANNDASLNYKWQDGSTDQALTTESAGTYAVTVTNNNGCQSTDEMNLTVNPNPNLALIDDITICEGNSIVLDVNISNSTYEWSTGSTDKTLEVSEAGTYSVTVTDNNDCQASDTVDVSVKPIPEFNIQDTAICFYRSGPVTFTGPSGLSTYQWSTGDTTQEAELTLPGDYALEVTAANNCSYRDEFVIENDCETEIVFPTAFSPNGDGTNDRLRTEPVNVRSITYRIYNRWGNKVYVTNDLNCNWNGEINGEWVPVGMYVVIAKGVDNFGIPFESRENVMVIR